MSNTSELLDLARAQLDSQLEAALQNPAQNDTQRTGWTKAVRSEALAVHPKQRKKAMENARARGVPTYFDRKGRPVFHTSAHMRAFCKMQGMRHFGY